MLEMIAALLSTTASRGAFLKELQSSILFSKNK